MNKNRNILFIVEGQVAETLFVSRTAFLYGFKCEIMSVKTNIHVLYERLLQDDGFSDVLMVLKEILQQQISSWEMRIDVPGNVKNIKRAKEDIAKLDYPFESVYLVFDSEFQHSDNKNMLQDAVQNNYNNLRKMLEFFDNETEFGKLYVNYPMSESWRDCDDFFDEKYKDRFVSLDTLFQKHGYKRAIASRRLASFHINKIRSEDFNKLICMNVCKLNMLIDGCWEKMKYEHFLQFSEQQRILEAEYCCIKERGCISVLNTALFFAIDFWGEDFYKKLGKE